MNTETNYALEEYKMLKEETKTYVDQSFRDFQIFIGIAAILFTLLASAVEKNSPGILSNFSIYALMQIVFFVFIIIQFNRVLYLLVVRKHLSGLEELLNKVQHGANSELGFKWESKIVPKKISDIKSPVSISQIIIGIVYLVIFAALWFESLYYLSGFSSKFNYPRSVEISYYVCCFGELFVIAYSLFAIRKQRRSQ